MLMRVTSLIGMLLARKAPLDGFVPWQVLIFEATSASAFVPARRRRSTMWWTGASARS